MAAKIAGELNFDPYELLEVGEDWQEKDIIKAFRKKALQFHPDKNPDRKAYAEDMFLKISKAFELLTDAAAKAAYDRLRKAKAAARERTKQLDVKRRKFKEELEAKERVTTSPKFDEAQAKRMLDKEIERLRKEGSKLLQREKEELEKKLRKEAECAKQMGETAPPRLRIRWQAAKNDSDNGGYSEELLRSRFSKFGTVTALVMSRKKNGSAMIEFGRTESAVLAVDVEKGLEENPLEISWVSGKPVVTPPAPQELRSDEKDFESVVLSRLRQAEERKRLIQQIQQQDQQDTACD